MPHNGFRDLAKPFIAAYKAGATDPTKYITEDKIVYWYRPTPKGLNCDATDNIGARPDGYDSMQDAVYVVSLLKNAGKVKATSGSNSKSFDAPAGVSAWQVNMGVGQQVFSLERNGKQVFNGTSSRDITDTCPCGLYNYNVFVGTVPAGDPDALSGDSFAGFARGLKVACTARPLLPIRVGTATHTKV
ncbi:glycoside hydrolase family 71 protein [Lophiostoma macrostomum CBS 122681]|uniref:Glycoside hydrolase family 71 protein n=1 Tax=Lophiostoma macrostomum CBS 122681 TaxID=1314788 RepID=A0A6A6TEP0_9PLEO|nr:glycoside hydrolase family 71 protein [Lophiostoma macrostomum CBS 122681]